MFQRIEVKGYRSLRDVTWEPGRLNVLIGANASGKSNLLRAVDLLRHAATGRLAEEMLREGGFNAVAWDGAGKRLAWSVRTDRPDSAARRSGHPSLQYDLDLDRIGHSAAFVIGRERLLSAAPGSPGRPGSPAILLDRDQTGAALHSGQGERRKMYGRPSDHNTLLAAVGALIDPPAIGAFRDMLASLSIFHDVNVGRDAPMRADSVARVDRRLAPDAGNLIAVLHTLYTGDHAIRAQIDAAMWAAFGDEFAELQFPPSADQRVQMRLRWKSLRQPQPTASLSDGTLRFLVLVAALVGAPSGAFVAIDEPETGLHPRMMAIVADLARETSRRAQVVLSTHSTEFLDGFGGEVPAIFVTRLDTGATQLQRVEGKELARFLKEYRLGALFQSGELESMA